MMENRSISVQNISKSYGKKTVLKGVSFEVTKGEVVGLLGRNGVGKTTLMHCICGLDQSYEGQITINGISIKDQPSTYKNNMGYLAENNPLYQEMYVVEFLSFMAKLYNTPKKRVLWAMEQTQILDYKNAKIQTLSKGYKQRVGLAACLLHNPQILILDEPTNGLDPSQLDQIKDLIRKLSKEKTIIISSHIMQEIAQMCDRVLLIHKGKIVSSKKIDKLENSGMILENWFRENTAE